MRIELSRLRETDKSGVIAILVLVAAISASAWLVADVSKRESAVDALDSEVRNNQLQVDGLPKPAGPPLAGEQLDRRLDRLFAQPGTDEALREQIARIATENNVDVRKLDYSNAAVDPGANEEDVLLRSFGVSTYTAVTIEFHAEYENAARFLGALERLPQPVSIRSGELRRDPPQVGGSIALRVYRKGS